jgi:hypothetical protein
MCDFVKFEDTEIELKLVKYYGNKIKYKFRLCKPELITIKSSCRGNVGLKINKCFEVGSNIYKVNKLGSIMHYNNLCTNLPIQKVCLKDFDNYYIFELELSTTEDQNKICLDHLDIVVDPVRFDGNFANAVINLNDTSIYPFEFVEFSENVAPTANNDSYTFSRTIGTFNSTDDTTQSSVSWNDIDPDNATEDLCVELVQDNTTAAGSLKLNSDGTFTFIVNPNIQAGTQIVTFTYMVHDFCDSSNIATVTLTIT